MRPARYRKPRTRVAHADLPVRREEGFAGGDNAMYTFEWSPPVRKLGVGAIPGPLTATTLTREVTACEIRGRFNNCDVYITAPFSWIDPTTVAATDAVLTLNLYAMIQGTEYPIHNQVAVLPGTLPDLIVIRGGGGVGDTWRALALSARGRPCDGFKATISVTQTTPVDVRFLQGQVSMLAWGEETASISATFPSDVTVSGVVSAAPALAAGPLDLIGTAPDGSGGGVATQLPAHTLVQGITIQNDPASGGVLYVSTSATTIAGGGLAILPGGSSFFLVSNADKLFVNGSAAGVVFRAMVLA